MNDKDIVKKLVDQAISGEYSTELFKSDNRWINLHAYAEALRDRVNEAEPGFDPLEWTIVITSLALEQFPEVAPVDEESMHIQCVHMMLKNVLGALRKYKIGLIERGLDG